jgi:hypothetical protein
MKKSSLLLTEFRTALVSKKFLEMHRVTPTSFTRTRTLTFGKIVGTLLQKVCKSLQIECNFLGALLSEASVSKQAFSKAWYKVGVSTFQDLHQRGKRIYSQSLLQQKQISGQEMCGYKKRGFQFVDAVKPAHSWAGFTASWIKRLSGHVLHGFPQLVSQRFCGLTRQCSRAE